MDNQKEEKAVITNPDPFIVISPFSGRSLSLQEKLQVSASDLMYCAIKLTENETGKADILNLIYGDTPKYRNAPNYISDALVKSFVFMELLVKKAEFSKYVDKSEVSLRYKIKHIGFDKGDDGVFSFTLSVSLVHNDIDIVIPFNITASINLRRLYFKYKKNDYVGIGNTTFYLNINSNVLDCDTCNSIKVINKPENIDPDEEVYYSDLITYEVKNAIIKLDKSLYSILHHTGADGDTSKICESCEWIANSIHSCNPFYELNVDYDAVIQFLQKTINRSSRYINTSTKDKEGIKYNTTSYYIASPETDIFNIINSSRFEPELYNAFTRILGLIKDYSSLDEEYKESIKQEVKTQNDK